MFKCTELATLLNAETVGNINKTFSSISIDSRRIKQGTLFVPIKGEKYDGHDFITQAVERGAAGVLMSSSFKESELAGSLSDIPIIFVNDTLAAFQSIASYHRTKIEPIVVGITGSNGKTTTKDMVYEILSSRYNCLKNKGNFNNHIGLPITLLELNNEHEVAIVELGINKPGEIDHLCKIARPDIGVITNIGYSHLEGLGGIEGVFEQKGRILNFTKKIILNGDDKYSARLQGKSKKQLLFGMKNSADISGEIIGDNLLLKTGDESILIKLAVVGQHNFYNALAAAAVARMMGLGLVEIKQGLQNFRPEVMRMERYYFEQGVEVINDAYNSNPSSCMAAIAAVRTIPCSGRRIVVLGDMLELGELSAEMHEKVGRYLSGQGINKLFAFGDFARHVAEGALDAGMNMNDVQSFSQMDELLSVVQKTLKANDLLLVKGSRGMRMERVVEYIQQLWSLAS